MTPDEYKACKREYRRCYCATTMKCKEASRSYRAADPSAERERHRRYYEVNRDKHAEWNRRWRAANPDKAREINRRYREALGDKQREVNRRWREAHAEHLREYRRKYHEANREVHRAKNARRRVRIQVAMSPEDIRESVEWRKKIKDNPCFYCGAPGEHDDHYMSLARGGTDHWWNLVRACAACNLSKNAKCGDCFIEGVDCTHAD